MDVLIIVLVIVIVLAAAAGGFIMWRRQRSGRLQEQFGPEYDRTVEQSGGTGSAEKKLAEREKRRSRFDVVPLSAESAAAYGQEWDQVQMRFVDQPASAVEEADALVVRVMRERGYPVDDFDQRADDLSVDHPHVVQHYRTAHTVAVAQSRGEADTEQLRQAVTSYRALVDALLDDADHPGQSGQPDQARSRDQQHLQEER
ncbi:MAG TPA: hypothetical protein VNP20_05395 [Nocardioidaceae bacterium]|nr:hypothetical protein [Nocardioidaceae bacterium]